jgi:hypothetical protein
MSTERQAPWFCPIAGASGSLIRNPRAFERGTSAAFRGADYSQQGDHSEEEETRMVLTSTALLRPALCAGLFLAVAATAASADERCQQLVALNQQYKGVALTSDQKQLKVQLVSWYKSNCMKTRSAAATRARAGLMSSEDF